MNICLIKFQSTKTIKLLFGVKVLYLQNDDILDKTSNIPIEVLDGSMINVVFLVAL